MSAEEPPAQAAPEPPGAPPQAAPAAPPSSPQALAPSSGNGPFAPHPHTDAYTVLQYTPPSQLISAGDHVLAHVRPDAASPGVVMFGPGVALTITGRVSRGFADDWYAIAWNNQTAFIRQQDATPGTATAPPPTAAHVIVPPRAPPKPPEGTQDSAETTNAPPPVASGPFELSGVRWVSRPSRRDYERAFPQRALNSGQSGRVTLDCTASGSGGLDCSVANELPRGYGFGNAALNLSRQFRIAPTTSDGRPVAGGHVSVPVEFRAN
ncbi:MAG: TonB family protein [Proteobacteria bacterium]|nr:TonB family protein [Pseudomonadota bacterium]